MLIHSEAPLHTLPEELRFIDVKSAIEYDSGIIFKKNRFRCVRKIETSNGNFFLKQYFSVPLHKLLLVNPLTIRNSEGFREYVNIKRLQQLGIKTMEPVLTGESSKYSRFELSFLVTREITSDDRLEDFMQKDAFRQNFRLKREILCKLADDAAKLHVNHYYHKDMYLGHFLIRTHDSHTFDLYMIDLQRIQKHILRSHHFRIKDIASLHFSIPQGTLSKSDQLFFLSRYLTHWGKKSSESKFLIRQILKKSLKIKTHTLKKQLRKLKKARS